MYLLGALKVGIVFRSFKTYGLLLIRNELSVGVELEVSSVNILWLNSNVNRLKQEIIFLINKIKPSE